MKHTSASDLYKQPKAQARAKGLRYVTDDQPGIRRIKAGKGFAFKDPRGKTITSKSVLDRIHALAIPPAYHDVWICAEPNGHLQATGIDDRGRKQYRYHADWRKVRDATKYHRMPEFGKALPGIRKQVKKDVKLPGLPKEKVIATIIELLEKTLIRVGNETYAKQNQSFGLTTLHNKHVKVRGKNIHFEFKGKSGVHHTVDIEDPQLARIVKQCQDVPGFELFQCIDEDGSRHSIRSEDINHYLQEITGEEFTAKDFRTWYGTVLATEALLAYPPEEPEREKKHHLLEAIGTVAEQLGNTASICRKCYIHPTIMDAFLAGELVTKITLHSSTKRTTGLSTPEKAIMQFLKK